MIYTRGVYTSSAYELLTKLTSQTDIPTTKMQNIFINKYIENYFYICTIQINFLLLYITFNMANPITIGHFTLLHLHILFCSALRPDSVVQKNKPSTIHVVLQCPIHQPPHWLHGLTVLNDETTKWLLNTFPEI